MSLTIKTCQVHLRKRVLMMSTRNSNPYLVAFLRTPVKIVAVAAVVIEVRAQKSRDLGTLIISSSRDYHLNNARNQASEEGTIRIRTTAHSRFSLPHLTFPHRALVCCHTPPLTTHLRDTSRGRACVLLIEP